MEKIDSTILAWHQGFSDRAQLFCGITNFGLAKCCIVIFVLAAIFRNAYEILLLNTDSFGAVIAALIVSVFLYPLCSQKESKHNDKFNNPDEVLFRVPRLTILVVEILFIVITLQSDYPAIWKVLRIIQGTLFASYYYFMACSPKPPQKTTLSKFLDWAKSIRVHLPQIAPDPTPSAG
jgi:hypothetical protein